MTKKKLFVVDNDNEFHSQIKSLCPSNQIELQFFSSSMEVFSKITKEKPPIIILNVEISDINEFVMHEILKKANNESLIVIITYSPESEQKIAQYKKLRFQAQSYHKKPISNQQLKNILKNYVEPGEDEDDVFSESNIDRLVRGEIFENEVVKKSKENTVEMDETKDEYLGLDINQYPTNDQTLEKKTNKRLDNELKNQLIALESQNEFLIGENKDLVKTVDSLKGDIKKYNEEIVNLKSNFQEKIANKENENEDLGQKIQQLQDIQKENEAIKAELFETISQSQTAYSELESQNSQLNEQIKLYEAEKIKLQSQVEELSNQLTDKERELVAKNHEFEKNLKKKLDELLHVTEERLMNESKKREDQLLNEIKQLSEEKEFLNTNLNNQIENLQNMNIQSQNENEELNKRTESLNRTISTLAEEKVNLSGEIETLKEQLSKNKKTLEEKEEAHRLDLKNLHKEIDKIQHLLKGYKEKHNQLSDSLQNALKLIHSEIKI